MADTVQTQVIQIDTADSGDSVEKLAEQMKQMTVITAEAAKGITHVGDEYQFASEKLQGWYDNLKKMHLEHNKTTVDLITGMQEAAAATKMAATGVEDYSKRVSHANEGMLSGLHHQRLAFEDLGRLVEGHGFSIRNVAANFGLLGTAATLGAVAIYEVGKALIESYEASDEALQSMKAYGEAVGKASEKQADITENVHKMQLTFKDADAGLVSRKDALDEYNKEFGKTLGYAKDYNEAEKLFAEKSTAYADAMKQRALADAAYGLAKKELAEKLKNAATADIGITQQAIATIKNLFGNLSDVAASGVKELNKQQDEQQKVIDRYNKIGDAATEASRKIEKASGIHGEGEGNKPPKKEKEHDNSIEEEKKYIAESQKILQDARDKEITNENIKYQKIYDDLVKHHHSTEKLTEQHRQNIIDINQKYDEKEAAELAKLKAKQQAELASSDEKLTADFIKEQEAEAKKKAEAEAKSLKEAAALRKELDAGAIKANQDANKQIIQSNLLTYNQKLALLKREIDGYKEVQAQKGYLNDVERQRNQDDLTAYKTIQQEKLKAQADAANGIASVLNSVSDLLGKNTQAGKDVAIAAATISAIQGAINSFTSLSVIPIIGPELGIIAAAAALAAGVANIKKIENTKVPGQSGGGSSSSSLTGGGLPSAPNIPAKQQTTNLSQGSIQRITNSQMQAEPVKAVVVERDMTATQQRVSGYRSGSSL